MSYFFVINEDAFIIFIDFTQNIFLYLYKKSNIGIEHTQQMKMNPMVVIILWFFLGSFKYIGETWFSTLVSRIISFIMCTDDVWSIVESFAVLDLKFRSKN